MAKKYILPTETAATIIARAVEVIAEFGGFRKSAEAGSTKDEVLRRIKNGVPAPAVTDEVKSILEWAELGYATTSDYRQTLSTIAHSTEMETYMVGYLASAVESHRKAMAKAAEAKVAAESTKWVGEVDEHIVFTIAEAKPLYESYSGSYNWSDAAFMCSLKDTEGNTLIWRCRYDFLEKNGIEDVSEMVGMTIKAKVKDHTSFRGVKQTRVWYCKVAA